MKDSEELRYKIKIATLAEVVKKIEGIKINTDDDNILIFKTLILEAIKSITI